MSTIYTSYSQQQTSLFAGMGWSKRKGIIIAAGILLLVAATVAGIVLTNNAAANQDSAATVPAARVTILAQSGKPVTLKIQKGQSVIWNNSDNQTRMLVLGIVGNGSRKVEQNLGQGETFSYVFDTVGTFNYYDGDSASRFSGVVIVE